MTYMLLVPILVLLFGDCVYADDPLPGDSGEIRSYTDELGREVHEYKNSMIILLPKNVVDAPGPGQPSSEALRSQGYVFIDRLGGDSLREVGRCRYEASYKLSTGETRVVPIELGCLIEPRISARVAPKGDRYRYWYTVSNERGALQSIYRLQLLLPDGNALLDQPDNHGWSSIDLGGVVADRAGIRYVDWSPHRGAPPLIPGQSIGDLWVTSSYLPGITEAVFTGAPKVDPGAAPLQEALSDDLENAIAGLSRADKDKVRRPTIGPAIPPPPNDTVSRVAVVDRLEADVPKALAGGLINANQTDKLLLLLRRARVDVARPGALSDVIAAVSGLADTDPGYRESIVLTLQKLQ